MPFVNVRTARGILDEEGKHELHERLTHLLVEIEGGGNPEFRNSVFVLIEEEEPSSWSVGGVPVTGEMIRELKAPRKLSTKS